MLDTAAKKNGLHVSNLIDMDNPRFVMEEVKNIISMIYSDFDFHKIDRVFEDVLRLFSGEYYGYRRCNTYYHDLKHTTDAMLAMTRLIHGAALSGMEFGEENVALAMISTMMHDTGYIQTWDDNIGTGGKYTLVHVQRSINFMEKYFAENGFSSINFNDCSDMLNCTGFYTGVGEINFRTSETELLGKMLGTADLVGQIADKNYIRKLIFLFYEFREAQIKGYDSELDLLAKTIDFYKQTRGRLATELGNTKKYLPIHFKFRYNIDRDLYEEAMEKNIRFLRQILKFNNIEIPSAA